MIAVQTAASLIIRLVLAVLMVVAVIGPMPASAGGDWTSVGVHYAQDTPAHDCCDPEPALQDGGCGLTCAQTGCGWTAFPATAGWPAFLDQQALLWETATSLPLETIPETATPPPRA